MISTLSLELEHQRERHAYYSGLHATKPSLAVTKWMEIYAERIKKLEKQITKLQNAEAKAGLRTELGAHHQGAKKSG